MMKLKLTPKSIDFIKLTIVTLIMGTLIVRCAIL